MQPQRHILTVDVEDWYQGTEIPESQWADFRDRIDIGMDRILGLLSATGYKGTFFFLGAVAKSRPDLVRRVADLGHEVGCHGYSHRPAASFTPSEFSSDLRRATEAIEDACGQRVRGYRAPYFGITLKTRWALDILMEQGYEYDASISPIHHHRCGIPYTPRFPYMIRRSGGSIIECPVSTTQVLGHNVPMFGGFYFRFFPRQAILAAMRSIASQGHSIMMYLHPWELDPDHPRIDMRRSIRIPHYWNLKSTESRLRQVMNRFAFTSVADGILTHRLEISTERTYGPSICAKTMADLCCVPESEVVAAPAWSPNHLVHLDTV